MSGSTSNAVTITRRSIGLDRDAISPSAAGGEECADLSESGAQPRVCRCNDCRSTLEGLRGDFVELRLAGGNTGYGHTHMAETVTLWWGQPWQIGTAAFWAGLAQEARTPSTYRLGETFAEELAACMLGGFGLPAALGVAAFHRVRDRVLLTDPTSTSQMEAQLYSALTEPLIVEGHLRRYRFPRQRARRLAAALAFIESTAPSAGDHRVRDDLGPAGEQLDQTDPVAVRDWLLGAPGVGPKTASWVVRNYFNSDAVAIIDVHVHRAGLKAGVFDPRWRLPRDYILLEQAFLAWAVAANTAPSLLDACIWATLARRHPDTRLFTADPRPIWPVIPTLHTGPVESVHV